MSILACPRCHAGLESSPESVRCTSCSAEFSTAGGFIDFIPASEFQWGELTEDHMDSVVRAAEQEGWPNALWSAARDDPYMTSYLFGRNRMSSLMHALPTDRRAVCVEVGSGWGTLAFGLADLFEEVWSVEGVGARVRLQTERAKQEGRTNFRAVRSWLTSLPFADASVDVVVCNGVLEWVGLTDFSVPVRELQEHFLTEAFRVLKPGGVLFIGIENRFSGTYALGERDHSGLRYTSLMPRWLADEVVRRRRPGVDLGEDFRSMKAWPDYRTYTYSLHGYRSFLRQCGFQRTDAYWVWPNYNTPRFSGKFEDESLDYMMTMMAGARRPAVRLAAKGLGVLPRSLSKPALETIWPGFLLYAFKGEPRRRLEDEVRDLGPAGASVVRVSTGRFRGGKHTFLFIHGGHVKKALHLFEAGGAPTQWPRAAEHVALSGFEGFIEDGVDGAPMDVADPAHLRAAAEWLRRFQQETAGDAFTAHEWTHEADRLRAFVAAQPEGKQARDTVESLLDRIGTMVARNALRVTAEHGDFHAGNVFVGPSGAEVIDWDVSRDQGSPLLDVSVFLHFLSRQRPEVVGSTLDTFASALGWKDVDADALHAYAILRILERDSVEVTSNGKKQLLATPALWLDAVESLKRLSPGAHV